MNMETGEVVQVEDGQQPPKGFTPLPLVTPAITWLIDHAEKQTSFRFTDKAKKAKMELAILKQQIINLVNYPRL